MLLLNDRRRGLRVELETRGKTTKVTVICTRWRAGAAERAGDSLARYALGMWEGLAIRPAGKRR